MNAAVARIFIRYLAAALTTWGILHPETAAMISNDPDLQIVAVSLVGFIMSAANEFWYVTDRKKGKTT